jgi:hypothetical protein
MDLERKISQKYDSFTKKNISRIKYLHFTSQWIEERLLEFGAEIFD